VLLKKGRVSKTKISWKKFDDLCQDLATGIVLEKTQPLRFIKQIYGIPRGGLVVAVKLSHLLNIPLITDTFKIDDLTLIVDDLTDSGEKLSNVAEYEERWAHTGFTATLFHNGGSKVNPDFWVEWKPKGWVQFPWETEESTW
jgi:hypoxanthine phosphoribosyltransferase